MSSWLVPVAASALALGLFVSPTLGDTLPVLAWFAVGATLLALAVTTTSRGSASALGELDRTAPALLAVTPRTSNDAGRHAGAVVLLTVAIVAVGIGWGAVHAHRLEGAVLRSLAGTAVTVEASLRADPATSAFGWSAIADVRTVTVGERRVSVRESVWLSGEGDPPGVRRGDLVRIEGEVGLPHDEGFGSFLRRRGLVGELEVAAITRLGPATSPLLRWAQVVRAAAGRSFSALFPEREAGLLLGLSLGDDSRLDPALERDFRASGLSHLLVVSGGNVAMVLAPVLAFGAMLRLSRWPRFALGLGAVASFVILTGAEPSVMRAGVMAGISLVGILAARPRSAATTLAGAVFVLLVLDPTLVWSLGFQLSVLATGGMIALATPIAERLRFLPGPLAIAAGATLAAQLAVTPLLLASFHEVPLSALLANVAAFPAVGPAMLLGLGASVAGAIWLPLGRLLAFVALIPLRYLEIVADRTARAPVPWITGGGGATLVVGLAVVVGLAWWLRSRRRLPRTAVVGIVALVPIAVWSTALSSGPPSSLTVRFFDVGQGDAALLSSPGGASILVDGGPDDAQVATELAALGVKRLDVVVASHPHADHIVGLPAVLARFPVGVLLEPGCETDSTDAAELDAAVAAEAIEVRHPVAGDVLQVGDVRLEVLSPDRCWSGTESDTNNDALVVRASIGADSVLFATEPEEPAQQALLDAGVDLEADVLKVPHHGAATSIRPFFDAVAASVAVVSVGPNPYGHPVPEILGWLEATGADVLRTDRHADVVLSFRGGLVSVDSAA